MAEPFEARGDGLRLYVKLTPKSAHNAIAGIETGADGRARLAVRVTAAPEKGKANKALLKLLADELGVAPSALELIAGATTRLKTVGVSGLAPEAMPRAFRAGAGAGR